MPAAVGNSLLHIAATPRTTDVLHVPPLRPETSHALKSEAHDGAQVEGGARTTCGHSVALDQVALYAAMPPSKLAQLETLLAELAPLVRAARVAQA